MSLDDEIAAYESSAALDIQPIPDDFEPIFRDKGSRVTWRARAEVGTGLEAGKKIDLGLGFERPDGASVGQIEAMKRHLRLAAWQSLELVRLGRHTELG